MYLKLQWCKMIKLLFFILVTNNNDLFVQITQKRVQNPKDQNN